MVMNVAMLADEREMLLNFLRPGTKYIEFGTGDSTLLALQRRVAQCVGIETDAQWLTKIREHALIREAEAAGQVRLHHVDIGEVGPWGVPLNRSKIEKWPSYFLDAWSLMKGTPDVVLVDGRFRTACACTAMMAYPRYTTILINDFFDENPVRANYRRLLEVAEIVESQSNLVSLRRKEGVDQASLMKIVSDVWVDYW